MHSVNRKEVPYNAGKSDCGIAFVFACPGQEELDDNKLVSGATGKNLDRLIGELRKKKPDIFQFACKYDYCITNASSKVYFKGYYNSRTLPYLRQDVYTAENLNRLNRELSSKKVIISFGKTANKALRKANIPHIQARCHLGYQGINRISIDSSGQRIEKGASDSTNRRINVIAKDILEKLKRQDNQT